jgi:hypothetical protein
VIEGKKLYFDNASLGSVVRSTCFTAIEQEKDAFAAMDWEEQVKEYVVDLQVEIEELINATPQTPEDRHQVFLLKKQIVNAVLAEARIDENREVHVKFRTDFPPVGGKRKELTILSM